MQNTRNPDGAEPHESRCLVEVALLCAACLQMILPVALPELAKKNKHDTDIVCARCASLLVQRGNWRIDDEQMQWLEEDAERTECGKMPCRVPSQVGSLRHIEEQIADYIKDAHALIHEVHIALNYQGTAYGARLIEKYQQEYENYTGAD